MTTAYVDFGYYAGTYLGEAITEDNFPRLALRASAIIDRITFNRAATDTANTDAIKMACCAVAEEIQAYESDGQDGIQSETIGQNSVTYNASATKQLNKMQRYQTAAFDYLIESGLMFTGFLSDEYADE